MRWIKRNLKNKLIEWLIKDIYPPREYPLSDFERIQYEIKPCDILLVEGRSRISDVIRYLTQSPWTHAALYIGRLHEIENPSLRKHIQHHYQGDPGTPLIIESVLGRGTIISPITTYLEDHVRICRPHGIAPKDVQRVIAYAIDHLGEKYATREIFDLFRLLLPWRLLPRRWGSSLFKTANNKTIMRQSCSSLLAEAFASVQFPILPIIQRTDKHHIVLRQRNPRLFTPSDFDYSPFFDIIKYPMLGMQPSYRSLPWQQISKE